jgi:transposase-like protein
MAKTKKPKEKIDTGKALVKDEHGRHILSCPKCKNQSSIEDFGIKVTPRLRFWCENCDTFFNIND